MNYRNDWYVLNIVYRLTVTPISSHMFFIFFHTVLIKSKYHGFLEVPMEGLVFSQTIVRNLTALPLSKACFSFFSGRIVDVKWLYGCFHHEVMGVAHFIIHFERWHFPRNKPSSEFGVPPWRAGNPDDQNSCYPTHWIDCSCCPGVWDRYVYSWSYVLTHISFTILIKVITAQIVCFHTNTTT